MPDPKMVTLPHYRTKPFDVARLNEAMDVILEVGTEAKARTALVHTYGWPAGDVVEYAQAAQHCFDNGIDPNGLPAALDVRADAKES